MIPFVIQAPAPLHFGGWFSEPTIDTLADDIVNVVAQYAVDGMVLSIGAPTERHVAYAISMDDARVSGVLSVSSLPSVVCTSVLIELYELRLRANLRSLPSEKFHEPLKSVHA